jgi:hypothetical protein
MTCGIGMAALAAVSVFVVLAAGMYAFLVRRGLRRVRDLEKGIDGDRDPEGPSVVHSHKGKQQLRAEL